MGYWGLLARLIKSSVVNLITSSKTNISIQIDENYGILNSYNRSKDYLVATNFTNYELIMKNDEVYTSGLGLIPEGIYVGKVITAKDTNNDVEQNVLIKGADNYNNIKYVAIIRGIKQL